MSASDLLLLHLYWKSNTFHAHTATHYQFWLYCITFSIDATVDDGKPGRYINHSKVHPYLTPKVVADINLKPRIYFLQAEIYRKVKSLFMTIMIVVRRPSTLSHGLVPTPILVHWKSRGHSAAVSVPLLGVWEFFDDLPAVYPSHDQR